MEVKICSGHFTSVARRPAGALLHGGAAATANCHSMMTVNSTRCVLIAAIAQPILRFGDTLGIGKRPVVDGGWFGVLVTASVMLL